MIIKKFALWFGVVFVVFAGLAALINYELNQVMYTSAAPASLFEYSILTEMLPFLLAAVISFIVVVLSSKEAKAAAEKETEMQKKETKEAKTQPEYEDIFKEAQT